jgi:hypothetical protein
MFHIIRLVWGRRIGGRGGLSGVTPSLVTRNPASLRQMFRSKEITVLVTNPPYQFDSCYLEGLLSPSIHSLQATRKDEQHMAFNS